MKTAFLLLLLFNLTGFSQNPLNLLEEYIKIDTKENTREGVFFFKKIFENYNIEYKIIENGEKPSIIAKIEGTDKNLTPFLLTHHIDCVNKGRPLVVQKFYMEGPCLLDDKSLGIAHLISFLEAKKAKPKRGIYFLAVSDEEKGGKEGIEYLIKNGFLPEISFAIGEGGKSSSATDQKLFITVSNTDKGVIWIEVEISLPGGHSLSLDDGILKENIKKIYSLPSITPFKGKLKEYQEFISWYKNAFPREIKIPQNYEEIQKSHQAFTSTTIAITSIKTDGEANVMASKLKITLDIRTASVENHRQVLDFLKKEFPGAKFNKILEIYPSPTTPSDNIYFKRFIKILKEIYPSLPIGPSINPGFSDLSYLREKGIPSMGFSPFFLNYYHYFTVHKDKEHLPEDRFLEGVELMKRIVLKLSEE
ncbi:MAG: M20/M25/M40 family metallo-hydrolase [Thermoanaerobaculia bacterium]